MGVRKAASGRVSPACIRSRTCDSRAPSFSAGMEGAEHLRRETAGVPSVRRPAHRPAQASWWWTTWAPRPCRRPLPAGGRTSRTSDWRISALSARLATPIIANAEPAGIGDEGPPVRASSPELDSTSTPRRRAASIIPRSPWGWPPAGVDGNARACRWRPASRRSSLRYGPTSPCPTRSPGPWAARITSTASPKAPSIASAQRVERARLDHDDLRRAVARTVCPISAQWEKMSSSGQPARSSCAPRGQGIIAGLRDQRPTLAGRASRTAAPSAHADRARPEAA